MKALKYLTCSFLFLISFQLYAQEILISKDSLYLTYDDVSSTSSDSLIIYSVGTSTLNIDTIYCVNASGFVLDILLNDTTIHSAVTWRNNYYNPFTLEPDDSAILVFIYPLWIPKFLDISETWIDSIIILNNSLNIGYLAIHTVIDFPLEVRTELSSLPLKISLLQNYPNRFNPSTIISFTISDFGF